VIKRLFIFLALLILAAAAAYCFYCSEVSFAAFTRYDSPKVDYYIKDKVVTPYKYFTLKLYLPQIKLISEQEIDSSLASGNVVLLPWWEVPSWASFFICCLRRVPGSVGLLPTYLPRLSTEHPCWL